MQKIDKIDSVIHPWIQHLKKLVAKPDYRKSHNSTVITSKKILDELSDEKSVIHSACTGEFVERFGFKPSYLLADSRLINYVSGSASNDGILIEVKAPEIKILSDLSLLERSVIIPRIRDPGNMGMLARCARALHSNKFIVGQPGSVDPFNYKSVSTSRGTILDPKFIATFCAESSMLKLKQLTLLAEVENKIPSTYVKLFEKSFLSFYGKLGTKFRISNSSDLEKANIAIGCESNGFDDFFDYKTDLPENFQIVSIKSQDKAPMNMATSFAVIAATCWSPPPRDKNKISPGFPADLISEI